MKLGHARSPLLTVLVAVVLVLGGVAAHGQRPQGGTPGPMLVDFSATTADGKPATGLTAADLSIKVGGKVRSVSDLKLKTIAAPAAGTPAAAAAEAAPTAGPSAPFFTNEASGAPAPVAAAPTGRYFLIVVDSESLVAGTEGPIKAAIENLLKDLTPADRVAFSIAPHDTAQVGFGTSLAGVRQAVSGLRGQKPANASANDAVCRTSDTLNLLKTLVQQAPGGETPMAMVVIASSFSRATGSNSTGSTCTVTTDQYNSMPATIAAARVNVYVVQGDSAVGRDDGLENLAGVTGAGAVMRVANEGFAPRVLADASSYWIATLAPDPSDKPGQSQRLELKTTKEGVTIHTRPEVMMSRPSNAASAAPAAGKAGASLKDIVASSATFTDLQLRANAVALRGAGPQMNVIVQAEPIDPSVKITAMKVGFIDAAGKAGALDAPQLATYPISTALPLGVGQYKIRVAATDSTGKSGAVDIKIDTTPVAAGPFKLGGLMLLTKGADGKLTPRLQFNKGEPVTAMFELYGVIPPAAKMIVAFEIAPADTATATKQFRATGSAPTPEPDKANILGELPIADLPPGDYVIRGIVQLEGSAMGKTIRTLRIK